MKRIPLATALIVAGLCAVWASLGLQILPAAFAHDFLNLYTGATLARDGNFEQLHVPEVQLAREQEILPAVKNLVPFVRPAFYAAALLPISWLPYKTAFAVWITFQTTLLLGCWVWAWKRFGPDALIFSALVLPGPLGIASGQDCVTMLVLFIGAFELARRERMLASGAVLALMLAKFHLVLLWPLALLLQRRWSMLAGYAIAAGLEATFAISVGGWGGVTSYFTLLRNKDLDHLSPSPELMISYQGVLANLGLHAYLAVPLILGVVLMFVWSVRSAPLWRLFSLTAVASQIIVPHVYGYDATLLLLPLLLIIFNSPFRASRIAATLMATPLPFGFALAGRPWAIVSSVSMIILFAILAMELIWDRESITEILQPADITGKQAAHGF